MKFLKQKTLSRYSPSDNAMFTNHYGRAVMDLTGGLRLPKGTTAQRPQLSSVRTPNGPNGFIRYNTDSNEVEAYVDGAWETVVAPGISAVTRQELGPGDDVETTFGPLDEVPSTELSILVYVENVFQHSDTNFNLVYDYLGTPGDTRIVFTSPVPLDKYVYIYYGYV
jgi:uncharacterized protein YozE (UPF0346 family)